MGSDLKVDNNNFEEPSCYFPTRQEPNIKLNVKVTKNGPLYLSSVSAQKGTKCSSTTTERGSSADVQQNRAVV